MISIKIEKCNKIFPILECDCCCSVGITKKCYIKQCDYHMCSKCLNKYQGELCPKCRNPMKRNTTYLGKVFKKFQQVVHFIKKKWLIISVVLINGFLGLMLGNIVFFKVSCTFSSTSCEGQVFNPHFLTNGIIGFMLFIFIIAVLLILLFCLLDGCNYCFTLGYNGPMIRDLWNEIITR
jgi:hypothetical protein